MENERKKVVIVGRYGIRTVSKREIWILLCRQDFCTDGCMREIISEKHDVNVKT